MLNLGRPGDDEIPTSGQEYAVTARFDLTAGYSSTSLLLRCGTDTSDTMDEGGTDSLVPQEDLRTHLRPSLFDLLAQEQLRDLLHPVFRYVLSVSTVVPVLKPNAHKRST